MPHQSSLIDLSIHGIHYHGPITSNLSPTRWVELAIRRHEGILSHFGALVCNTGSRTGRSPKDKFIVQEPSMENQIDWQRNQMVSPEQFRRYREAVTIYFQRRELFVQDASVVADPRYALKVRVIADQAWHALFSQILFRSLNSKNFSSQPEEASHEQFEPDWTVMVASDLRFKPEIHGSKSETVVAINFAERTILIVGTQYAGEIKKSIFTILNALLPLQGVLPMHCSANIGKDGSTALFFGLSGTGKTTLSADPERQLIGDDEHGWSNEGIFNIEGGCYAKTIRLSAHGEPQIWSALRFGTVLENVPLHPETRIPDFEDESITENTRGAYPIEFIPNAVPSGMGNHPKHIFFLSCDTFGVLPPLALLNQEQIESYFLCGYTAKVGGTEYGVKKPQMEFSTCFASPFLPLPPRRYAMMLLEKLRKHPAKVWLLNTGWTGGPYGTGHRFDLAHTRALLRAALADHWHQSESSWQIDPIFGLRIPPHCPGVPSILLQPRSTWTDSAMYDQYAAKLVEAFRKESARYQN